MSVVVLAAVCLVALFLVPLGLPGLWLMLAAAIGHDLLVASPQVGWTAIGVGVGLAVVAEYLEWSLAGRYAKKYGGSRRAGWGALVGGLVGAIAGVPVPIVGSMVGAFFGAFVGALVAEYTNRDATAGSAARVAKGALIGRVVAAGLKAALGTVIAVVLVASAALGGW